MTKKLVKDINFFVYNNQTKNLIKKFENIWARKFDIDNAFDLFWSTNSSVLELWCFNWREYSYISEKTNNYFWIDISKEAIEYANNKYNSNCFIVWDFENYIFDKSFDIVFAFASLIHSDFETTKNIFNKVYNLLNDWWIFYVSMKSNEKYAEVLKEGEFWKRIYYHYSMDEYIDFWKWLFDVVYKDEQIFNNQSWFTLAFKKKTTN